MRSYVLCLLCAVLVCGCRPLSMNKKLAYSDSAATLATAAAIDEVPEKDFDTVREKTIEIAAALLAFVDSGNVADLSFKNTRALMQGFMTKKGYGDYMGLVDAALQYVKTKNVDVDKLGDDNVLLIRTGLEAVIKSATRCKKQWRQE